MTWCLIYVSHKKMRTSKITLSSIIFFFFLISVSIAGGLPEIPKDCLKDRLYCSQTYVEKMMVKNVMRNVARINVFAVLSKDDWESPNDVVLRFIDFDNWPAYAAYDGTNNIKIKRCFEMSPLFIGDTEIHRQYLYLKAKAPAPIFYIKARSVVHYWLTKPIPGAHLSASFEQQTNNTYVIPGEDILEGAEGIKYNSGEFHLRVDPVSGDYYLYFFALVVPEFDFLLKVAATHIELGYVSIFRGMFDL